MRKIVFASLLVALSMTAAADTEGLAALRAAAERGQVDAQYELGVLYEFGYRFPDHKVAAFAWYSRAAAQGSAAAARRRDLLEMELSAAERERARTLVKAQR